MSSKSSSVALFFMLNVLVFTLVVSACNCPCPKPTPTPEPKPSPGTCPLDTLKLGVCANVLNGLLNVTVGKPPKEPCCPLIKGLADLEAAVCLCTAIKGNVLGLNLNIPVSLSLLLNYCGQEVPKGFECP